MTQQAISVARQQSTLALAVAIGKAQATATVPFDPALCTEVIALDNKQFAEADPQIQDIVSCDGRHLADQVIQSWRGAWQMEFLATSRWAAWALACAWGGASAASPIAQSNSVWTLTITASAGTYAILIDGKPTAQLTYNANAAAIQAAIDAVIGAGKITVGGTGPWTLTAAGAWLNQIVRAPRISPATTFTLTGTATIVTTTPGGPARSSYTITQDDAESPPQITGVLGYTGGSAWLLGDLTVDTLNLVREDNGLYRIRIGWVWSGLFQKLPSFTWQPCSKPRSLETRDGGITIASVDHSLDLRALEYSFANRLEPIYVDVSKFPQAIVRQFPLTNQWTAEFEENLDAATSVHGLVTANGQDGTKAVSMSPRAGHLSDGVQFASPDSYFRLNGTVQRFGGTPPRGRVPALIASHDPDSASTKPVSATVITDYAGGFLAAA